MTGGERRSGGMKLRASAIEALAEDLVIEPIFNPNSPHKKRQENEWKRDTSWKRTRREQFTTQQ
jgi:hypothetical protein